MMPEHPVYCLFSGGKDSFAAAKQLQIHGRLTAVVLLDTGIAIPDWEQSVLAVARQHGFPAEVYRTPIRYEWLVERYGFPGAGGHSMAMTYLKGRAIREFKRAHPRAELASGVRWRESNRRAVNTKEVGQFEGVTIYSPIFDWTTDETWAFCRAHGYEKPPQYIKIGVSGDCLCGSYARPDEREALREFYPEVHERICAIERSRPAGAPRCKWGWANAAPVEKTEDEAMVCVECGSQPARSYPNPFE